MIRKMTHAKMIQMKKALLCVAALALLCVSCVSCANSGRKDEGHSAVRVRVAPVETAGRPNEIEGFGSLSFLTKNDVVCLQEGEIATLYYREGGETRAGALLAVLKNPRLNIAVSLAEQEYTQAQAAYRLAKTRLIEGERNAEAELLSLKRSEADLAEKKGYHGEQLRKFDQQETLYAAGAVNEESIRSARFEIDAQAAQLELSALDIEIRKIGLRDKDLNAAGIRVSDDPEEKTRDLIALSTSAMRIELEAAETSVEMAYKNLVSAKIAESELRITSPVSGVVAVRNFEEGEYVKKEDVLFTILNAASLYATIPVREADAFRVTKGMPALVRIEGTGGEYPAQVDLVSPVADIQSFMFNVRLLLDADALSDAIRPKPGMFAQARITLGEPDVITVIDDDAIINKNKNAGTVFVVQGQNATMRQVAFGGMIDARREITDGLRQGELVVRKPAAGLKEGSYVQIITHE
jgi:multidrug efflux pump subunit AcrA (membrane-fusion protein)